MLPLHGSTVQRDEVHQQRKFSDHAIETALTLRLVFKLPLRQNAPRDQATPGPFAAMLPGIGPEKNGARGARRLESGPNAGPEDRAVGLASIGAGS